MVHLKCSYVLSFFHTNPGYGCADSNPAPELSEDDATSEAELESDDESALQWLSEPPADFGRHLSGFGQLFTLVEGLVTARSSRLLRGGNHADSTELPARSSLQVNMPPCHRPSLCEGKDTHLRNCALAPYSSA